VEVDLNDLGREFFRPGLGKYFEDSSSVLAAENRLDSFSLLSGRVLIDV
jgi:hypothetical protein